MTDIVTEAPPDPAPNGQPRLPEGSLALPPAMVARLTRVISATPGVQDLIGAYVEGKEAQGPFSLVIPAVILLKQEAPT